MFTKKSQNNAGLEKAIDELQSELSQTTMRDSEKYTALVEQLKALYALKDLDRPKRVSPDTWAIIAANLAGIVLVIGHERVNVISTKALSFVPKLR